MWSKHRSSGCQGLKNKFGNPKALKFQAFDLKSSYRRLHKELSRYDGNGRNIGG